MTSIAQIQKRMFALLVVIMMIWVTSPLITSICMGAVLAVLVHPLLEWLEKRKMGLTSGAGLLTLGVTLLVLLPATAILFAVTKSAVLQLQDWREWKDSTGLSQNWVKTAIQSQWVSQLTEWVSGYFPVTKAQIVGTLTDAARAVGLKLTELLGDVASRIPNAGMSILLMILSMYFFLIDGRRWVMILRRNSFFTVPQTDHLTSVMGSACRSVILASLVSGVVQSVVEALFALVVGVEDPLLVGGLVLVASFIPIVGSAPVTLGVAAQQFMLGRTTPGFVLLIAAVVVGFLDNFIRPMVLRGSANLHPLLAFVAAFGGIQTIGVLGVFLGPIVAALFIETIHLLFQDDGVKEQ